MNIKWYVGTFVDMDGETRTMYGVDAIKAEAKRQALDTPAYKALQDAYRLAINEREINLRDAESARQKAEECEVRAKVASDRAISCMDAMATLAKLN